VLAAIGLGLSFVPVTIAAGRATRPQEAGLASGLVNTAQQVGDALGLAISRTIANSRTNDVIHGGQHNVAIALTKGFERAFLVGSGFALLGALLTAVLISRGQPLALAGRAQRGKRRGAGRLLGGIAA